MVDRGSGVPLVLIPGVQGRWEWMVPTVDALSRTHRVLAYSLCGEPGSGCPQPVVFDDLVEQVDRVLDQAGVEAAVCCGVSFGGWIALRYAAQRTPRVLGLVLVSTPSPAWRPDARLKRILSAPWRAAPAFLIGGALRMRAEVRIALPGLRGRAAYLVRQLPRIARAPMWPPRAAARMRLGLEVDLVSDRDRIRVPTLVVSGEPGLDKVVPVSETKEYARRIPGATYARLDRTGHLGLVTHAERFAALVTNFTAQVGDRERARARPTGLRGEPSRQP